MTPRARAATRAAVQIAGLLLGIAALAWCVRQALDPRNTDQIARLREAPPSSIAAIVALTLASLLLNGLVFWATIRPIRRLSAPDVVAVNALATFLAYLPFKLGALARIVIHNRRDRVPILVIGAWFSAIVVLILSTLGPLIAVSLWHPRVDAAWALAGLALVTACSVTLVCIARALRGERGLARLDRILAAARLGFARRALVSRPGRLLHQGLDIIACPRTVAVSSLLRLADAGAQAGRFLVAASILGQPLAPDQAVLIAVGFFAIGVASPVGMLGFREAGAAGLAGALAYASTEEFAAVALLVGATDAAVNLVAAAIGLAWLWRTRSATAAPPPDRRTAPAPP